MGSNMQRQAVPLLRPQAPIIGTGIEKRVARDSGQVVMAKVNGVVTSVTGREIIVTDVEGNDVVHPLVKFARTNQGTCFDQRPIVAAGDVVVKGDILADSSSTEDGELALGQNVLVAFMSWEGYNYEDAIIISERLVKEGLLHFHPHRKARDGSPRDQAGAGRDHQGISRMSARPASGTWTNGGSSALGRR